MFNRITANGKTTKLYHHQTDGGAEYLTDAQNETGEGIFKGANLVIRIDGGELEFVSAAEIGIDGSTVNDMRSLLKMLRTDVLPEPACSLAESLQRKLL